MPCLHSLRSWAMHFTFARLCLAGKMIISPWLRLGQIIFIGALINCLAYNHHHITTIVHIRWHYENLRNRAIFGKSFKIEYFQTCFYLEAKKKMLPQSLFQNFFRRELMGFDYLMNIQFISNRESVFWLAVTTNVTANQFKRNTVWVMQRNFFLFELLL